MNILFMPHFRSREREENKPVVNTAGAYFTIIVDDEKFIKAIKFEKPTSIDYMIKGKNIATMQYVDAVGASQSIRFNRDIKIYDGSVLFCEFNSQV